MELRSKRLILRELALDDKCNLFKLFSEELASEYEAHLPTKDIATVQRYVEFHMKNAKLPVRTHYYFVIELRESREFLGMIGLAYVGESSMDSDSD